MEWCCAKCGLTATADDWALLLSMGWRMIAAGELRCVLCVKRESERARPAHPVVALDNPGDRRRALR
jgi:hypothetical protein